MDMVLLDWTRMGKLYCLAGAVSDGKRWKFVRPMPAKYQSSPIRNNGWSPYLLANHSRWEIFKLVGARLAPAEPPHLEDVWVTGMHSRRKLASAAERRAILEAGLRQEGEPLFGECLSGTRTAAYLKPGTGTRSLATLLVDAGAISFNGYHREGSATPHIRVTLAIAGLENRSLPVKDHWLLLRAEQAAADPSLALQASRAETTQARPLGTGELKPEAQAKEKAADLEGQLAALAAMIEQMGPKIAVRLGLSRSFDPVDLQAHDRGYCWLMADGFFSFDDPQP